MQAREDGYISNFRRIPGPDLSGDMMKELDGGNVVLLALMFPKSGWSVVLDESSYKEGYEEFAHAVTVVGYVEPYGFKYINNLGDYWGVGGCGFVKPSVLRHAVEVYAFDLPSRDSDKYSCVPDPWYMTDFGVECDLRNR